MSAPAAPVRTTLLYRPLALLDADDDGGGGGGGGGGSEPDLSVDERDAGRAADLFVYRGRLTTLPAERDAVRPAALSCRAARHFFCPVCARRVRVAPALIACGACAWDGAQAGIRSVPQLLQREADPYPALSRRFRHLVGVLRGEAAEERAPAQSHAHADADADVDVDAGTGVDAHASEALFGEVQLHELVERRVQAGRFLRRGEPARRRLAAAAAAQVLRGEAVGAAGVMPRLQVELVGRDAVVQLQNARDEDVSVLVCAAGEDDGQALTLGADVVGEARVRLAEAVARAAAAGDAALQLDVWFCFAGGPFGSYQFGVRVFGRRRR